MGANSKINKQSNALKDAAAERAATRKHQIVAASAGAETVPAFEDSLGGSIADASTLSADERAKAKKALHG